MKKSCELCNREARMYCDSDQASLCWDCDERVHTANFIVAKHSRNLLCHVCQSITQWKASGSKFGPTFSVCNSCYNNNNNNNNNNNEEEGSRMIRRENQETEIDGDFDDDEDYSDSDSDEDEDEDDEEEEEDDGENQVVPWSIPTAAAHSSPVATTSSSSEIGSLSFSIRGDNKDVSSAVKRFRNNPFPDSEDEEDGGYCYSQVKIRAGVAVEDNASTSMPTTRRIGRLEGLSPQCQRSRERCDTEWQSTRIMDVRSSMLPRP